MKYDIDLYDGHLLITDDGKTLLLDTGSPVSLTDMDSFTFAGQRFSGHHNIGGTGISKVSQQLEKDIDVLVGMDVLSRFTLTIDYRTKTLEVDGGDISGHTGYKAYLNKSAMGAITIQMDVDGVTYNFALDTGAKISYINRRVTSGDTVTEERHDFNPILGYFQTPIFNKNASIGEKEFKCKFGNLPQIAETTLAMVGIDGVIGYDLFDAFKVTIDFKAGLIYLS